ncbi:MAG: tyrosine-type recombinase/integrase [Planctomycetota bacterium]|nr:tyrosine-type recombinase/integrase [Planctomycetota bacterium]
MSGSASQQRHTYNNGQPYRVARGRDAPRSGVEDRARRGAMVIRGRPTAEQFIQTIVDELRLRFYRRKTVSNYKAALQGFLRWFGRPPNQVTRDDVRHFLLFLVDAGVGSSWVSVNLSAIRTAFDKFCGRDVTWGLATPRKPKRLPLVLSEKEVRRLLDAAPRIHDKLLLGLMYASGLRVSEVSRLRWRDVDFDRRVINVWQGKGQRDRQVILPQLFRALMTNLSTQAQPEDFLFTGQRKGRHLSPRTAQRIMERAVRAAGIGKRATPHSLRHSFATHAFEQGCDIRRLQKQLGHVHLETTTIYVKVARPSDPDKMTSPLDRLAQSSTTLADSSLSTASSQRAVGTLRIKMLPKPATAGLRRADASLLINPGPRQVELAGICVREARPGWVTLDLPSLEKWESSLSRLTVGHRERIEDPAFFELLQRELPRRLLALPSG